jgi:hypothetical protein
MVKHSNECNLIKEVLELDFQFCQLIGWHTIGPLRDGGCAGL